MKNELKVGDIVRTKNTFWKDLRGMKILRLDLDSIYCVVDNKKDIGDGVISIYYLEIDLNFYRTKKLKRILK
jgi:hypothetical protein